MKERLSEESMDLLFREARTHNARLNQPVSDETLRQLYDLMKWGPTSANSSPARILFLRTPEAKQRLLPALAPGNVQKTLAAPVTAIIAYDVKFYEICLSCFHMRTHARGSPKPRSSRWQLRGETVPCRAGT